MTSIKSNYTKKIQNSISNVCLQKYLKIESAYWVVVGILLLCGIFMRVSIPQVPFTGPDSIGYLGVAVRQIMTGEFHCIAERSWPYPGFLTLLLNISPDFRIIPFAQHLLGCVAALVFAATWWKCRQFNASSHLYLKILFFSIGCFGCYLLSFGGHFVFIENWTHPESISAVLQMILAWLFVMTLRSEKPRNFLIWSTVFLYFLNLLGIFQPRMKLTLFVGIGLIALTGWQKKIQLKRLVQMYIAAALIITLTQVMPFKKFCSIHQVRHTQAMILFGSNMKAISKVMQRDLESPSVLKKDSVIISLETFQKAKDKDASKGVGFGWYKTLGYNLDLFLDPSFYNKIIENEGANDKATKFYREYFFRSLLAEPREFLKKIVVQLHWAWFHSKIFEYGSQDLISSWQYTYQTLEPWPIQLKGQFFKTYLAAVEQAKNRNVKSLSMSQGLLSVANLIYRTAPSLAVFLLVAFCIFRNWGNQEIILLWLLLMNGAVFLVIAIAHSTEPPRYVSDQAPLLIFLCAYTIYLSAEKTALAFKKRIVTSSLTLKKL